MKLKSIPVTVAPGAKNQKKAWKKFLKALKNNEWFLGRDLITGVFPSTKLKKDDAKEARVLGYEFLFKMAIEAGNLDDALEVAPFSGHLMVKEDYLACKKNAIATGRLDDKRSCARVLRTFWSD
ncbi:MAG: hypothetical protein V4469_04935 [Patescibacteria group bacterium]